jgi:hypothetical protein
MLPGTFEKQLDKNVSLYRRCFFAGCTATQVRWDATNIRKQVMVYYNDQIMDNLIRAKNHVPFVHVDITLLTSQGSSQISGTIGAGENRTSEHTSRSMGDALGTLSKTLAHPFAYSVTPQQTETLSIQAAPPLGTQAIESTSLKMAVTKETESFDGQGVKKERTTEKTPTAKPVIIYEVYRNFAEALPLGELNTA